MQLDLTDPMAVRTLHEPVRIICPTATMGFPRQPCSSGGGQQGELEHTGRRTPNDPSTSMYARSP